MSSPSLPQACGPAGEQPSGAQLVSALRAVHGRSAGGGPAGDPSRDAARAAVVQRLVRHQPADPNGPDAGHGVRQVLRSPGRPLAEPIRREMETAFGTDFSTVRLHENDAARQTARQLGARAYTSGENVVLGNGAVDKHTLAHELAHVVQQRAGAVAGTPLGDGVRVSHPDDSFERAAERTADAVLSGRRLAAPDTAATPATGDAVPSIQRKIGFEFETNLQVHANGESLIAKNAHIFDAKDASWYITPDGGTLEFVTKAFQEEGDKPELEPLLAAVGQMAEAFGLLHTLASFNTMDELKTELGETLKEYGAETVLGGHPAYVPGDIRIYPPTATPQATGGVSLAKMKALFETVVALQLGLKSPANPEAALTGDDVVDREDSYAVGFEDERKAMAKAKALAVAYCQKLDGDFAKGDLEGLLVLTFTYLLAGANQRKKHDQAKYFLPLMSRMSFSAMYGSLTEEAQAAFDPAEILTAVELPGGDPMYKHGFKDPKDAAVDRGPTRTAWLTSIKNDAADKMSLGGASNVAQGMTGSSEAMGKYGALEDGLTAESAKLVQIELRRLPD
ncbi:MAG: DUF4157 domain-containing protein, partial [Actinobacteria bacterium]|nr:DUF4157 domain-containing protein [Actinomycetota bacterium]